MSTDYVYQLADNEAATEDSPLGPRSVYGRTKLAGERAVQNAHGCHVILRTAWVFSDIGQNFVKTILRLASERDKLTIVADQWGNPTAASDIAAAIISVSERLTEAEGEDISGVYNFAGRGDVNWAGFARSILEISGRLDGPNAVVEDISTQEYPTRAERPANSKLHTQKFESTFGTVPSWKPALETCVAALINK